MADAMESNFTSLQDTELLIVAAALALSSSLSVFGSLSIIYIILKRREWQTAAFQRIMIGLSLSDLVFSGTIMLHPFLLPSSTGLSFALGNDISCNIGGFLTMFWVTSTLYSCFLSAYFFLFVRRGLSERVIQDTLEPWIHIASWGLPMVCSLVILIVDKFRPTTILSCVVAPIPEDEGKKFEHSREALIVIRFLFYAAVCISAIAGIALTWLVYLTVRQQARRNQAYEFESRSSQPRSSQRSTLTEAVGWQAIFYSIAFGNTFFAMVLGIIVRAAIGGQDRAVHLASLCTLVFLCALFPLQGFLNWLVYVRPKLISWRQAHPEKSWCWAYRQVLSDRPLPTTTSSSATGSHLSGDAAPGRVESAL